jgi:hypothetical protein
MDENIPTDDHKDTSVETDALPLPATTQISDAAKKGLDDLPSKFDQLKFIRDEIKFEHSLLGQRVSWLLASNAFLLAAFAASTQQLIRDFPATSFVSAFLPFYVIPMFGLISSVMLVPAVNEAARRINDQRKLLYTPDHHLGLEPLTQILRPGRGNTAHNLSVQYAVVMPVLCIILWVVIFLAGQGVSWMRTLPASSTKTQETTHLIPATSPPSSGATSEQSDAPKPATTRP